MERRSGEERREMGFNNSMGGGGFTTPNHPEITVKLQLPLAPILPERRGTQNHPLLPTRRGTAIFSPTQTQTQTRDHPYLILNPRATAPLSPPPPPDDEENPDSSPDPDPPSTTVEDASNSIRNNSPPPPAGGAAFSSSVKYRECLKNHAASMGGHVVDGCGEFMPSGDDGTPQSLRCAACDCHRNFHRKEIEGGGGGGELHPHGYYPPAPSYSNNPQIGQITYSSVPPHQQQRRNHHKHQAAPSTTMVNFGGGSGGGGGGPAEESSSEDLSNMFQSGAVHHRGQSSSSKKRFRTKFSQEQKDRMQEFAARVGWRIQKQDEEEMQQFCAEVGVSRQVFKVWMHNNKQAMKRRQTN